ncbi:restriction endonuclease [Kribbella sp. HUAS MG21]|uniref:Restriction endonuclease n=1 Tax=Kribbella sp. HUAS MG21 TaxID=3160966 RepID=A0AAU7TM05_9ACTN
MKKSAEFEQLVAKIVAELETTAVVTWDDHIVGKLSGRSRQIDVSIRRQDPDFLGIIDAKDYSTRPATIERIDALTGVMRDVEAQYGALVCSGGFSKSIYDYARNCGVSLFNVHDAQSANWSLELQIPIVWTELTPLVQITGEAYFEAGDQVPDNFPMTTDNGRTIINPLATFERRWNDGSLPQETGIIHRVGSAQPVQAMVLDASNDHQLRPVSGYGFVYTVQAKAWLGKFQPEECRGLVDYLDGEAFHASYLPDSAVPLQRDDEWMPIVDHDQLAITSRGTVAVCTAPVLISDAKMINPSVTYLGPGRKG